MVRMVGRGGDSGQRPLGDGREVGVPPGAGDDEELGTGLAQGESHLALAVEVDDRVLDGAEAGERDGQDDGVDPGRQLPRDDGARRDAHAVQAGGDPLGPVAELPEGDRLAVRRDEHGVVRRRLGSAVDQLPHGAGAGEYLARGHDPSFRDHSHSSWRPVGRGWPRRAAGAPAGQNGCVARRPVHSEAREAETGGGGEKAVDRRRQVRLVGIAVAVILLGWFAVANTRRRADRLLGLPPPGAADPRDPDFGAARGADRAPDHAAQAQGGGVAARPPGTGPAVRRGGPRQPGRDLGRSLQVGDRVPIPAIGF